MYLNKWFAAGFSLFLITCSSSRYVVDLTGDTREREIQLARINELTDGNSVKIILKDSSVLSGFGFLAKTDSCLLLLGDINRYSRKSVATREIKSIHTSQKMQGGGILLGSVLAGGTFLIFKDSESLRSGDYFMLVGGSFLVGSLIGESFQLIPIRKNMDIQLIHVSENSRDER